MNQEKKQGIFLILMVIVIILLIITIVIFIKNKNLIAADPLTYGMKTHSLTSCQCTATDGKVWYITIDKAYQQNANIPLGGGLI